MRSLIRDPEVLVKAVASGKQRGTDPAWRRAEIRYVDLKSGTHLQITTYDATQAFTANHAVGDLEALDALLDLPFARWVVTALVDASRPRPRSRPRPPTPPSSPAR